LIVVQHDARVVRCVDVEVIEMAWLGHVKVHTKNLLVRGVAGKLLIINGKELLRSLCFDSPISGKERIRSHEEMTHIPVAVSPSCVLQSIFPREKFVVHKRSSSQKIVFSVMGHSSPIGGSQGLHGSVQMVQKDGHFLIQQKLG
jgi:hypothetical protein